MSMSTLLRRSAAPVRAFSTASVRCEGSHMSSGVPTPAPKAPSEVTPHQRPQGEIAQAGVVSGVPDELHSRPVRIFRPSPPSTSSAKATSHHWRIDWDILQGAGRWENPLMGWASSADYMQGTHLKFDTKEAAIHFCEKQGYEYFVQEPQKSKFVPKSYAANYKYNPNKLRIAHTK